ncbi:hypothetical protein CCR75_000581 [Bremia lactucae]|uniref:Uncharacterized protein n=1 Tax=Bremia lactucae TaxID=4779 RepID=A0A976NYV9_BRELC|nr:hypothetical protein CCR75_000581 [Bremia lactucae]
MDEPWDPSTWDGNADELLSKLDEGSADHTLKQEIYRLLTTQNPITYRDLITFVAFSATLLSRQEQQNLTFDVEDVTSDKAEKLLMQKYQCKSIRSQSLSCNCERPNSDLKTSEHSIEIDSVV